MPNTDKTILLPQLQRYDQNIKGWADNKFLTKVDTPSLPPATATTLGAVYARVNSSAPETMPLGRVYSQHNDGLLIDSINEGAIKSFHLADGAVTSAKIANSAITAAKLASNAVTTDKIADGAITTAKIEDGSIGSTKLEPSSVTRTKIADNAIEGNHIRDSQIMVNHIKDGSVTSAKLALGAVDTENIKEGAIVSAKINDGAIKSAKLANGAVTVTKLASGAVNEDRLADGAVTRTKIADGTITAAKLASNAVTTDKIVDGAITKAKLASDVGVGGDDVVTITFNGTTADKTWNEVDALYKAGKRLQVLSTEWGDEYILPLVSVMNNGNNLYNFSAHYMNGRRAEVNFWHDPSIPDSSHQKEIFSKISDYPAASKTSLGVVKVGDGLSITSDGTLKASGAGGGGSIFNLGKLSKGTLLSIVSFDCGNFIMYLVSFNIEPTPSGSQIRYNLHGTDLLISPKSTGTVHIVPPSSKSGFYSYTLTWFQPKSASAKAALATLLPVQDECEQMEAEVAKLEQDWIDNQDDIVAVDGNGVPITIATKKTELKKKQAELEKLREDYFSKLGDWKNEVQE